MTTTTTEFRRDRHGFPIDTCHRCGGTGRYSFNLIHGDMCYGCSGSGLRFLVPKHHAAWRDAVREAVRVITQDLQPGDRVRRWGDRSPDAARTVAAVSVDHDQRDGWSTVDGVEHAHSWRTTVTWDDGTVEATSGSQLWHRLGVNIDPAPYIAAAERGVRYLRNRNR